MRTGCPVGLIDQFTIIDGGRNVVTLEADAARARYQRIRARFARELPELELKGALQFKRNGRELELVANGDGPRILEQLKSLSPESLTTEALSLEEVFVAALK